MSSLPKDESMGTKLVELFANRVVERRNMINDYLSGRACIESVRGSWFQGECSFWAFELILSFPCSFELLLALLYRFAWLCRFSCLLLAFAVFLLLDDILELFFAFWVFSCTSWDLGFKFQTLCFCCQWTHQGRDWETKWSVAWIEFKSGIVCFVFLLSLFHWRIAFACPVGCRWQVRHDVQWRGPWQE
jgi:hypothetical protein